MRIVVDYRPALRARTGVGEYIHQAIKALAHAGEDEVTLFSSSWKDRPAHGLSSDFPNVHIVDQRIPVRALNLAWHRLGWPPVEAVAGGSYDVAHSPHPLLLPSRSAAQLVTIHDVHFLSHPERTSQEIRRDYPSLAAAHARRADRIIVSSRFAAGEVQRAFELDAGKIAVCPAGAPEWANVASGGDANGYVLFMGTLEARKNVGGLLQAYGQLLSRNSQTPKLMIAGGATPDAAKWLEIISKPPLAGHVEYLGYVEADRRESLFRGARLFVLPSFEEGFGLPALEAMAAGVPVVASDRGALPEVVGDAGLLVDPQDTAALVNALERIISDDVLRANLSRRGLERARQFTWTRAAADIRQAYQHAVQARRQRDTAPTHANRR
ncbi:MAG: glycosyltransferase family 4 protein [Vicinamibacterales bacterium]|nr:glycosyltransferase family 4 protein [Vicinamibacterales bacterium]